MMKRLYVLFAAFVIVASSCKKPEGEGGRASISGTVTYARYDHNGKLINTELAKDQRVYVVYGDEAKFNDDRDTYTDGSYKFDYLRKGTYSIVAFEDCNNCDSDKNEVEVQVDISKNSDQVEDVDLELRKNVEVEDGYGTVTGRVWTQQYIGGNAFGAPYIDEEQRVYIVYDSDSTHFERVDTDANGYYVFRNLIIGNYTVYAYSGCASCGANLITKENSGAITEKGGTLTLDITIEQH